MIISEQDTTIILQDTVRKLQETTSTIITPPADSAGPGDTAFSVRSANELNLSVTGVQDTASVSIRDPFYDIIFSDTLSPGISVFSDHPLFFPFTLIKKSENAETGKAIIITSGLHEGKALEPQPFRDDWIIIIVLASAFIYSTLSAVPGRLFHNIKAFLLFRGIGDPALRERGIFSQWQSILANVVSFSGISLFAYCSAAYYGFYPVGLSGILLWIIIFGLLILLVLLRHLICILLGGTTGEKTVFGEYCATVYHSCQITGFILFLLTILLVYTSFPAPQVILQSGLFIVLAAYFMRVLRLFLIFLKRNISILYFILYLCALEFLPVLVVLKYFTDLF